MSRPLFCLLSLAVLALIARPAPAQNDDSLMPGSSFDISGQVRATDKNAPARNILVQLEKFGGGLIDQKATDSSGKFRFSGLSEGAYVLSVNAPGFVAPGQQVTVNRFYRSAFVIIQLEPERSAAARRPDAAGRVVDARVPVEAQREVERAQTALREKSRDKAIVHLEKAVQIYPTYYEAQWLLGTIYMDERQWDKAESALRRTLEINPKSPAVLVSLGEVHRRQKRYAEAEQAVQESLRLDDQSWRGHFTLGRIYWETGNIPKAGHHTGRTLQLKPDYAEAHLLAGNIFMRVNMPENALVEYEEYLRLAPASDLTAQTRALAEKIKKALAAGRKP